MLIFYICCIQLTTVDLHIMMEFFQVYSRPVTNDPLPEKIIRPYQVNFLFLGFGGSVFG